MELFVKTHGEAGAPVLLLLHGLFGASTNWGSIARSLASEFHVLVPDLRNHGQSPHSPEHDYASMTQDLLGLLDASGVKSATIVGHSMGGKVAMHLALNHADRVDRLAVVDIAPVNYTHDFQSVLDGFNAVDLSTLGNRSDADAQMKSAVPAAGVRAFLLQNLVKQEGHWAWRLNLDALAANQPLITGFPDQPGDARYEGPTAIIYGELSDYVRDKHRPTITQYFPAAGFCPVEGANHWVYADKPQPFMACLTDFLRR